MKDWIIFALAISQIVILYWVSARCCTSVINKIFLDKNAAWVRDNPAFYARFSQPKYTTYILYALGVCWLFGLFTVMNVMDDTTFFLYTMMPNFIWQVMLLVYVIVAYFRIARQIPLPAKRSANLARRNLGDYVHPFWIVLCAACYLFVLGAYVVALLNHHIEFHVFVSRILYVGLVLLIAVVFLRHSLRRKKNFLDDTIGASFRRWEVIANFIFSMTGSALVVLWVMTKDLATTWVSEISIAVAWSVVIQCLLLYLTFNARVKQAMLRDAPAAIKN